MIASSLVVLLLGTAALAYEDSSEWGQGGGRYSTNCSCGWTNKDSGRIVGGRQATLNEYPLIAGIVMRNNPKFIFCGGTIISDRHVLTAAHCKPDRNEALSVVLAGHDKTSHDANTRIVNVEKMILHEQYNLKGHTEHDIALLVLARRVAFNMAIGPACFPTGSESLAGTNVRVIGWGTLYSEGPQPNILQKVDLAVQPITACARKYSGVTRGQLCTYTPKKDSCQGDSGGPVIWLDPKTNRYTVVGVVSYGYGCASPDSPGVNTLVSAYRDWVLAKMGATAPQAKTCQV